MAGLVVVALLAGGLASAGEGAPPPARKPLTELPYTPGLDTASMDKGVDPCVDFYRYSCGNWIRRNPIPPDQSRWNVYGKLADDNRQFLWGLLEEAARPDPGRDPARQKIGDHFAACMDEPAVEAAGITPLREELAAIAALARTADLPALLGRLHAMLGTNQMLFAFGAEQDLRDSEQVIAWAVAGGLGLPDRDYYLADDERSKEIRLRYMAHVERMLALSGETAEAAKAGAAAVMRIETALAKASLTRVLQRDPRNIDHRMTREELQKLTPAFDWNAYAAALGAPLPAAINVTEPAFFTEVQALLGREGLPALRSYLRWGLVNTRAENLSKAFVDADFAFYRAYLRGVKEQAPRWKHCVELVDTQLGEALGQVFVDKAFPPAVKAEVLDMTRQIEAVMGERIDRLDWMAAATKAKAHEKLASMRNKIGYPDRWRDYGSLEVRRGDFAGNLARATRFEVARQLAKVGRPIDRGEWLMTPPTVNAYYNPPMNDMNFPAGVLLPPLYDPRMDAAPNYGNTGGTIGHELIHGFDDSGRLYDARGTLTDWWTGSDGREFEKRAQCVVDQYAAYPIVDDIRINSKLTLGEDLADIAGTTIAYHAWQRTVPAAGSGSAVDGRATADGLSPEQRFFVGFAQWACEDATPETKRMNALTNPHSPPEWRINGVVANMPEFRAAFACKAGQPMVKDPVCTVW